MRAARRALAAAALSALLGARPSLADGTEPNNAAHWSRLAAQSYLERAERAQARGDTLAAVSAFTDALRVDPNLGQAYIELAELRRLLGDIGEAERLLSRATALSDARAEALTQRARLYRLQHRDELALRDLESAVEAEPSVRRLRQLGDFYVEQRAWVAALSVWRRVASEPSLTLEESERAEVLETLGALAVLAAEADAVQHVMRERDTTRRTLRRHARPARPQRRTTH